jgi:hypothetical protein
MQKGWTILFFICEEDAETKSYAEALLGDLMNTENSILVTLLCYESVRKEGVDGPLYGSLSLLAYDQNTKSRQKVEVRDFGVVDPGNESVLGNALNCLKEKDFLREKFLLFTWDHGAGFGIFAGDPRDRNETSHKEFKIHPGPRLHMLTSIEINAALATLGRKADLVIMMNCWTQMLETGFELSKSAGILVAPQTVDYFAGYDYIKIINQLVNFPNSTADEIADLAVNSVPVKFRQSPQFKDHLKDVVITASALNKSASLVEALDPILDGLIKVLPTAFGSVAKVRGQCLDFTQGYFLNAKGKPDDSITDHYIDLVHYLSLLARQKLIESASLEPLKIAVNAYLLKMYRGEKYDATGLDQGNTRPANGFSIYHPSRPEDFQSVYYQYFYESKKISLAQTKWGAFLAAYKSLVSKGNR